MENTHKKRVEGVLGLGINSIRDARFSNSGNVVVYTTTAPDRSTKIRVTNSLRGKTGRITWKSVRGNHRVFGVSELRAR